MKTSAKIGSPSCAEPASRIYWGSGQAEPRISPISQRPGVCDQQRLSAVLRVQRVVPARADCGTQGRPGRQTAEKQRFSAAMLVRRMNRFSVRLATTPLKDSVVQLHGLSSRRLACLHGPCNRRRYNIAGRHHNFAVFIFVFVFLKRCIIALNLYY